jgi:hypothetical protein|nr:MAG TPA: hypothetical protein [Caudoviricetes sp.]
MMMDEQVKYTKDHVDMVMNGSLGSIVRSNHGYLIGPGFDSYMVINHKDYLSNLYYKAYNEIQKDRYKQLLPNYDKYKHLVHSTDNSALCAKLLDGITNNYNYVFIPMMYEAVNQSLDKWMKIHCAKDLLNLSELDVDLDTNLTGRDIIDIMFKIFDEDSVILPIVERDLYMIESDLRYFDDDHLEYHVCNMVLNRYIMYS